MNKENTHIVLFDGECNLCNGVVQFIIRHDGKNAFRFASLQSDFGRAVSAQYNLPQDSFETFIYLDDDAVHFKSSAALKIARHLGYPYRVLYAFIILPRFIRDGVYMMVSRNRHKLFGSNASCMLPTRELAGRFVE
jgi:predicted DCC family thiol-disulfide oxidoreductase YuxK